ncbi:hypothetical protein COOONC_17029 [Cooperia oncophora]
MTGDGTLPCGGNLFLDYVCTLSNAEKGYLYSQPACALFVFRMLPSVSQQTVIKLIWNSNVRFVDFFTSHENEDL